MISNILDGAFIFIYLLFLALVVSKKAESNQI